mgnify:CR=1 FL=1
MLGSSGWITDVFTDSCQEFIAPVHKTANTPPLLVDGLQPEVQRPANLRVGLESLERDVCEPGIDVHSAGIWNPGPIREMSRERLEEMYRVNTFSGYYLAREAAEVMTRGSLVFIGSTAGERGEPGHSHYAGSKAALWGLVQSLAQELAPAIRVNLVSPGWVRTPMAEPALAEPGRESRIVDGVPLRRVAEPEDVAAAVAFLADDETARHLTGVDLPVSGGALLPLPRG